MNQHFLTIIVPCYNCASTLEEAVDSIYIQNLRVPFEIVMVNDASTDNTWKVMQRLAKKYKEIKLFFHEKNLGGGATRNTAIKKSEGDIIFCLDSDDMLTPGFLNRMIELMDEKKCDGVGIGKSIKFRGKNTRDIAYVTNMGYQNQKIPFESLFENATCPLYSTFLHTRNSYYAAGGYPENHGFDTQGFAFRFLANGLVAYGCSGATYMHRVGLGRSYYIREYESGKVPHNWFKIFDEFIFLFSDPLKDKILNANLNDHNFSIQTLVNKEQNKFIVDYREVIGPMVKLRYAKRLDNNKSKYDEYWIGSEEFLKGNFFNAAHYLLLSLKHGLANIHVNDKLFISIAKLQGEDINMLFSRLVDFRKYHNLGSQKPLYKRFLSKLFKTFERHN